MTLRLIVLLYAALLLTASTAHAQPPVTIPRGLGYGVTAQREWQAWLPGVVAQ